MPVPTIAIVGEWSFACTMSLAMVLNIRRATSVGLLLAADIAIFDAATITDRATFADPHHDSEGVRWVLVNGEIVLDAGKHTGARPGRVLRRTR